MGVLNELNGARTLVPETVRLPTHRSVEILPDETPSSLRFFLRPFLCKELVYEKQI